MYNDTYTIELYLNSTWTEVEAEIKNFIKSEVLYNKLKPAESQCSFSVIADSTLYNTLRTVGSSNVPVRIYKNSNIYFTGFIRNKFSFQKTQRLQNTKIECVTAGFLLKRKIGKSLNYINQTVNTIISNLLIEAGILSYNLPTISTVIPAFNIIENEKEYSSIIETLLYEYGYVYYFDNAGVFQTYKLVPDSLTTTKVFNSENILDAVEQTKQEEEIEHVRIAYNTTETLTNHIVFSDTTNASSGYKCNIEIPANSYMGNGENNTWFAELDSPIGEILTVDTLTLDIVKDADITVETFTQVYNRAEISIKNTNLYLAKKITKLDIKAATCIVKKDLNYSIVGNVSSEKIHEYQTTFIFDKTSANNLANMLLWHYKYSDFEYKLNSKTDYNIGDIVVVTENGIGTNTCIITQKETNEELNRYEYTLQATDEYTPAAVTNETIVYNAGVNTNLIEDLINKEVEASSYYKLLTTANSIKVYPDGSIKPELVQFQSKLVNGTTSPTDYDGTFRIYIDEVLSYTSAMPESVLNWIGDSILPDNNLYPSDSLIPVQTFYSADNDDVLEIRVELYDSSNTVLLDKLSIQMIKDVSFNQVQISNTILAEVPKYLGKFEQTMPVQYNRGDWFLLYGTTDSPYIRGLYKFGTDLIAVKLSDDISTNGMYYLQALNDILTVVADGNGTMTNYGNITYIENLATNTLMVQYLLGDNAKFIGTVVGGGRFNNDGTIADESALGYILLPNGTIQANNVEIAGNIAVDTYFVKKGVFNTDRFYPEWI